MTTAVHEGWLEGRGSHKWICQLFGVLKYHGPGGAGFSSWWGSKPENCDSAWGPAISPLVGWQCPQHPLHPPSWQHRAISPFCPPRNSHAGHCQCRFHIVCQLLKGEMKKRAVEGEEYWKILEQTAFCGTHLHSWAMHPRGNLTPPVHRDRCL